MKRLIKDAYIDALSLDADEFWADRERRVKELTDAYMAALEAKDE